jgi:uncharacterized protein YecE (DUF72 family)
MVQDNHRKNNIKIGTSGFSYDDWRGAFYPPELPQAQMLEFYCRYFQTVEINVTYYTIPSSKTFERLVQKTPAAFEFIVKTHQETTHRRRENASALNTLLQAVAPMVQSGKFKGFLAQFPYSFKNTAENRTYLVQTKAIAGKLPLFVEFRNYTWNNEQVIDFLQSHEIGYVNTDEPPLRGLLPPQEHVTNDTGYVRFHGRNQKTWWEGKGSARYNYSYNEEELREWLIRIGSILRKTYKTYIFFNNHPQGKAVKNAQQMMELLKKNSPKWLHTIIK